MRGERPEMLAALLDRVHAALMRGDIAEVSALTDAVAAAVPGPGDPLPRAAAERLARLAARNAACLEAAGRGLRAARRRLQEVRTAAQGLRTYDGSGRPRQLGGDAGALARRL